MPLMPVAEMTGVSMGTAKTVANRRPGFLRGRSPFVDLLLTKSRTEGPPLETEERELSHLTPPPRRVIPPPV